MIDWDVDEIERMDEHYSKVMNPSVNFKYFCRHFEEIYRMSLEDEVLMPDIFNDITFYTFNGVNARYKLLTTSNNDDVTEKLVPQRMKQRAQRQEAHNRGVEAYYEFVIREVEEFVERYPFWKELLRYK